MESFLAHIAYNVRVSSLKATTQAGSGHPTSCLSAADIMAVTFFYAMHFDPQNPNNPNNDRFILSKGHAAPALYAIWKELGILSEQDLLTLRTFNSPLEGHPTARFSRSEAATGSLGQGLSIGIGMALEAHLDKRDFYTYVLMGDMETTEGSVWEAAELASYYRLNNLVGIVDCNALGQSTHTMSGHDVEPYVKKFAAFGWEPLVVDGHSIGALMNVFDQAKKSIKPVMIVAKTIKGYGIPSIADKEGFHGKALNKEELARALDEMQKKFYQAATFTSTFAWKPHIPTSEKVSSLPVVTLPKSAYDKKETIATRKAYGQALCMLGDVCKEVVSLDAEVKNSTYAEFFAEKYPDRFFQSFIAEQNMIGMAVGLAARGKIPFVSTFGAFFSRAYDQVRMAAIGQSPLRLVGSHAGVSIGEDGPSQMALEDIAIMRCLINSAVLYPCDAVSTHALVGLMANRHEGITYLRTTRAATPVIYEVNEQFEIGGCKILRRSNQDKVCIVAAGITVFEALKAYEILKRENIDCSVIDLYSIKPLDRETLLNTARQSGNTIITVEDHYLEGGLGQAVMYALKNEQINSTCLAVTKLPRSGKPEELMHYEEIDAAAIVRVAKEMLQ